MQELILELLTRSRAAWRYRWHAVFCMWIVAIAGAVVVMKIPAQYEASARVYVDTQSVLRPLLSGIAVQPNLEQMIVMMSRTLISRPNVERVIRMADMDIRARTPDELERLVTALTHELKIRSAGSENLYTISYSNSDPQLAKRVVQSLLTIFVEGSLGNKRRDAESAQRFINDQLKTYNDRLVAAEHAVTEFKRRNLHMIGDGKQNYYTRLAEAEAALNQAALDLREAETSRDAIKRQLDGETYPVLIEAAPVGQTTDSEIDGRLQALQQKLDALRMSYTERHPDIIALNHMIGQLKQQKEREAKQRKPALAAATAPALQPQNLIAQQIKVSFAEAEAAVAALRARTGEFQRRVNALRAAANAIPQIEAEYTQLTRDYEVTKKNYDMLLSKLESAQISGHMETAGVVDFRVIDPPQVPSVPKAPNRPFLLSVAFLLAIVCGGALAVVMSQTRPTFEAEDALREVSQLPVLGTVPVAWTVRQARRHRRGVYAFAVSFLGLLSAYGAAMAALLLGVARS